jgi:hypothetical protein
MTDLINQRPWVRLRDAPGLLEAHLNRLTGQLAVAIEVLPDEILRNRKALTACLTEELTDISRRLADAVDENWVAL